MFLFSCRSLGEGHLLHPGSGPRHPLAQVCEAMRFRNGASVIGQAALDVMYSLRGQPFQSFFQTYQKRLFLRPLFFPPWLKGKIQVSRQQKDFRQPNRLPEVQLFLLRFAVLFPGNGSKAAEGSLKIREIQRGQRLAS